MRIVHYTILSFILFSILGLTACSTPTSIPETPPAVVEQPQALEPPEPDVNTSSESPMSTEDPESEPPQPTLGPDYQTITSATAPQLFSSMLPSGFKHTTSGTIEESNLLGVGNSEYFTEGESLSLGEPWCQVQFILWVVDYDIAQEITAEDILVEYGLQGQFIDLEDSCEAIVSSEECLGINFLVIKYGRVFVLIDSFYCDLQKDFNASNLSSTDMDIINNWLSVNETLLPYTTGNHDVGVTGDVNIDTARAARDFNVKGEPFPILWEDNANCISLSELGKIIVHRIKEYSQ